MTDKMISTIHSCCKNCVFAIYDSNSQKGCSLNYLDVYKNNNIEVLEAYDDEKEFYIINDKKCIGYRENSWFEEIGMKDASVEEKILRFKKDNELNYVIVLNLKTFTFNDLDMLLKQIADISIKPQKIILIRFIDDEKQFEYNKINELFLKHGINIQWRIQTIVDTQAVYLEILHNITMINPQYRFILSVENPSDKINYLVNKTNSIIHEDLGQILVATDNDKNCLIYSSIVYRYGAITKNHIFKDPSSFTII